MNSNMQMEYVVLRHFNITLNEELSVNKIKPVRPTYTKISWVYSPELSIYKRGFFRIKILTNSEKQWSYAEGCNLRPCQWHLKLRLPEWQPLEVRSINRANALPVLALACYSRWGSTFYAYFKIFQFKKRAHYTTPPNLSTWWYRSIYQSWWPQFLFYL